MVLYLYEIDDSLLCFINETFLEFYEIVILFAFV